MLVDTHCHLDFESFDLDRGSVISRAREAGIGRIVVPALDLENCKKVLRLAEKFEEVFAAVGVHPNSSKDWTDDWVANLRDFAGHEKVVAIGEIGLDYYRDRAPREIQRRALKTQLDLAAELDLPVILHNRKSDEDLIAALKLSAISERDVPGVLHSFSAEWPTAAAALDMGYYLGFTGPVTYKKADALREVVSKVPLNRIVVETDAPFLAPQKYRGKRNEPAFVSLVAERIAMIYLIEYEVLARKTTENAMRLFGLNLNL
jgi:TatD DNase family protein